MEFKNTKRVVVNVGDWYHFHVICDKIVLAETKNNPIHPIDLEFYRNGNLVTSIPKGYVTSFYYYDGIFNPTRTTVMNVAFENVL